MDATTKSLSEYIQESGIRISALAKKTGIPYNALWNSLSQKRNRDLRADEFLTVCCFIRRNPMDFYDQ